MRALSFVLIFIIFQACSSKQEQDQGPVLPKEKMVSILTDVHIAEAVVNARSFPLDTSVLLFRNIENQLLAKHHVTRPQFDSSYQWYARHVEEYQDLYAQVIDSLSLRSSLKKLE
jgi:hypothetical protein